VKVVWQKGPRINLKTAFFSEESESRKEVVSILIGQEDPPSLDTSTHNMMEDIRSV
jgi:Mg2+/Co2+ transporter CorC